MVERSVQTLPRDPARWSNAPDGMIVRGRLVFGGSAVRDQLVSWVDKAIDVQDGVLRSHLAQASAGEDPAATLETQYLATVSGAGAAVGGAASIPGVGTGLAVGLSVAETVGFLDASALFVIAAAQLRGRPVESLSRRRALFLVALLGDDAVRLVPGDADVAWGERLLVLGEADVEDVSRRCERWLVTRFGPRQGMAVVGRLMPFGIGAAVGAAGNAMTAKGVIARIRTAFPAAPVSPVAASPAGGAAAAPVVDAPTGKYAALNAYLASLSGDDLILAVDTLDAAVPGGLPAAARSNPAWWANDAAKVQQRAWLAAGLHVGMVDLGRGRVRFVRGPVPVA